MDADASLAALIRDFHDWEVEKVPRGTEWIACQADENGFIHVILARDLHNLRYKIGQAEREDAGEPT